MRVLMIWRARLRELSTRIQTRRCRHRLQGRTIGGIGVVAEEFLREPASAGLRLCRLTAKSLANVATKRRFMHYPPKQSPRVGLSIVHHIISSVYRYLFLAKVDIPIYHYACCWVPERSGVMNYYTTHHTLLCMTYRSAMNLPGDFTPPTKKVSRFFYTSTTSICPARFPAMI
jgi:hypothetical protein